MMRSSALARFVALLAETPQASKGGKGGEKEGIRRLVGLLEEIGPVPLTEWVAAIDHLVADKTARVNMAQTAKRDYLQNLTCEAAAVQLDEVLRNLLKIEQTHRPAPSLVTTK